MIEWKEEKVIDAPIEEVWDLFKDKNIQRIMPKVEEHTIIEKTETEVGAKHTQTYREGKRTETYIVDTLAYIDTTERKLKTISFILARAFEMKLTFELVKEGEAQTRLIYAGHNKGINFVGKAMLKLGNKKGANDVIQDFLNRVDQEATKK
ncbi:SRPBCC family protein [Thalassobacillus hwangdonensis]|uniref:SRPBCC family protein n=1 Tax=Thalassobacillus hwangdonensis TaxID=546108 RepID=A0ABW3L547_9BACI